MDDDIELIPIIIDINQDLDTIDPDSYDISIYYDIDISLTDITDEIVIDIENNSFPIYIKIVTDNTIFEPFQIIIPNDYTISDLIYDLETYYIGIQNCINSIEHQNINITTDTNFILYNNCSLLVILDSEIDDDSIIQPNEPIAQHNYGILNLFSLDLDIPIQPPSSQKMSIDQINTMETILFSNINSNTNNIIVGNTCVICSIEYLNDSNLRILPCRHTFHKECIDKWLLNYSNKCPICKQ